MSAFTVKKNSWPDFLFLAAVSSFFLFWDLGKGSLASWDEAIYATVAKGIFQTGRRFDLRLNGSVWTDKPPLAIWATAAAYKLFGINEFSARAFSAACGVGVVITTYLIGRVMFNRWIGFLGALVLISSSHFLRFARFGVIDAPLTLFLSLTLYFFWLAQSKDRYFLYAGAALGLLIMTKSFAALLVFPVILVYGVCARRTELFRRPFFWYGLLVTALIALPWHLYLLIAHRDVFLQDAVVKHLFLRTQTAMDGHTGNAYFYIRTLVNKYHPWILIGIVSAPLFLVKALKDREDEDIFLSAWMFVIFGIFTAVKTKLAWYIIPVYPALSLTVAWVMARIFSEKYLNFIRLLFLAVLGLHVFYSHIFNQDYSADIKGIAPLVIREVPADKVVYLYNYHETPALDFYIGRRGAYLETEADFFERAKTKDFYCLIHSGKLPNLSQKLSNFGLHVKGSYQNLNLVAK